MKYYCTELDRKGICYHEFQKGKFNGSFGKKDSLLIHEDNLYILHMAGIFSSVVPSYNVYGESEIVE